MLAGSIHPVGIALRPQVMVRKMVDAKSPCPLRSPIVASAYLAEQSQVFFELEHGIIIARAALMRRMKRCIKASGAVGMNALDVMALHKLTSRGRAKRQADICLLLNIEDTHTVIYALKKLGKLGLVDGKKQGKEMFYRTTDSGRELCQEYAESASGAPDRLLRKSRYRSRRDPPSRRVAACHVRPL